MRQSPCSCYSSLAYLYATLYRPCAASIPSYGASDVRQQRLPFSPRILSESSRAGQSADWLLEDDEGPGMGGMTASARPVTAVAAVSASAKDILASKDAPPGHALYVERKKDRRSQKESVLTYT